MRSVSGVWAGEIYIWNAVFAGVGQWIVEALLILKLVDVFAYATPAQHLTRYRLEAGLAA